MVFEHRESIVHLLITQGWQGESASDYFAPFFLLSVGLNVALSGFLVCFLGARCILFRAVVSKRAWPEMNS